MNASTLPKSIVVLAGFLLAFAANASAQIFTNVLNGANTGLPFAYFGNNANTSSGDSPKVGEVFTLASDSTLSSFSFYGLGNITASLQLNIAQWNPGTNVLNQATNLVGSALLPTVGSAVETYNSTGGFTTLAFNDLNLNLSAGTKYIAYLTSNDPFVTGLQLSRTQTFQDASGFGNGLAYLSTIPGQGWQVPTPANPGFLSLQYTATVSPIPEPSTYAALMGVTTLGVVALRRKRTAA